VSPATITTVDFVDLERQHAPIEAELRAVFDRILGHGEFVLGREVELFEAEFADYLGAGECIGVGSGTGALAVAMRAARIGSGDEVIVPAHTFIATALAVVHAGATPVFCDVDGESGLIDIASAERAVTPRTAAVIAVHLYGQACDLGALAAFADRHRMALIEDAAQAHGAEWDGRKAGTVGLVSAFSFYPSKNLGALGDGGAICTSDSGIAQRAKELRDLGQALKGDHVSIGYNERLDALQAGLLSVKLRHLDEWNGQRRGVADWYAEELPPRARRLPRRAPASDVFHIFPIRIELRDTVADALREAGIATAVHYSPALHRQPPFAADPVPDLPGAEAWAREELSLPMFAGLRRDEVRRVCDALERALDADSGEPAVEGGEA
jgi:dTDP-4-amino-4,6-dideoxygalactose transaminase